MPKDNNKVFLDCLFTFDNFWEEKYHSLMHSCTLIHTLPQAGTSKITISNVHR